MKAKYLAVIGLFLFLSANLYASVKIEYRNVPDILKDSRHAVGKTAFITNLKVVEEIKPKKVYVAQDESGNKVILNLVGKISVSSEFGKTKRIEVGTVYATGFKITKISADRVVYGNLAAIGFPHEIPTSTAQRQKEPETGNPKEFEQKQEVKESQIPRQVSERKQEQVKPFEPVEKKIEAKPVERPKIVEKTIEPAQIAKVEEPPKAEIPPIETSEPISVEKTKPIPKPTKTIVPEGRKTSEVQGTGIMGIIFYFIPLIIGAAVGSITYWGKTDTIINGINKFDTWVINKRIALKQEEGKGKIKSYWAVPILWILNGIVKLSENIKNEAIRCGAKTSAYLYLLGIVAVVTFYAFVLVIFIIVCWIILLIIGLIFAWTDRGGGEVASPAYVNSGDFGDYGSMKRYCKNCSHYQSKEWSAVNYECKLGHKTPEFGDTKACSDYKEQFTIGKETNYCDDCAYFGFTSCERGIKIPESKHACEKFQQK